MTTRTKIKRPSILFGLMLIFAFMASVGAQVHYYVIAPNGTMNASFANSNGLSGFLVAVNNGSQGLVGWATALIPFIILFVGLGYAMQDILPAGIVASVVAAAISVIGTGIGSAATPFISNTELYLFISLIIIFGIATFAKGILNPYGN